MNAKIKKIIENTDDLFPDDGSLDSYFNATEEKQKRIEEAIKEFIKLYGPSNISNDVEASLDYLSNKSKEEAVAAMVVGIIKRVK